MSFSGPSVEPVPVVETFTTGDLVTVITGVTQHFQHQSDQPQRSLPPPSVEGIHDEVVPFGGV